jgi:hypothetical protein
MAAPKGNKYNEVWNIETAEQFCDDVLQYILDNKKCRSLSEACTELGEYEELLSYLHNKFDKDFKSIKKAKDIVKTRLANQALDGIANPTMAIFLLKNNHNMSDKQQTDITTNGKDVNTAPIIKFVDTDEDGD